jgi:hypothetical protein
MSNETLLPLVFLSHLRTGLGASLQNSNFDGRLRAALPLTVQVENGGSVAVNGGVEVYGPGDIVGIDRKAIVRTVPQAHATDFLPNLLPMIEFDPPDFPWRYTPAGADAQGRLRPWLCLVVLADQEFERMVDPQQPLPAIRVLNPAATLPDLAQSWAWAHVQVTDELGGDLPARVGQLLNQSPERLISRLVCPRRLAPITGYYAFVVPASEAGRQAGLGFDPARPGSTVAANDPAWSNATVGPLLLPIYHEWRFHTGDEGDFETLVRRLQPRPLEPAVGIRQMDVSRPGYGLPGLPPMGMEGALKSLATQPTPDPGSDFTDALAGLLNLPEMLAGDTLATPDAQRLAAPQTADASQTRTLTPPLYGRWHVARKTVDPAAAHWFSDLNLDPRRRAAAGLGTRVIQEAQEDLMAAAWEQVGEINEANRILRAAQLARAASAALYEKQIVGLSADELLPLTAQVHARTLAGDETVHQTVGESRVTNSAVAGAFLRLVRPGGGLARRAGLARQGNFISRLNSGAISGRGVVPARPGGMVSMDDAADLYPGSEADAIRKDKLTCEAVMECPQHPIFTIEQAITLPGYDGRDPGGGEDSPEAERFRQAACDLFDELHLGPFGEAERPPLDLDKIVEVLTSQLDPRQTIVERVLSQLDLPMRTGDAPEDPLAPVMVAPEFDHPMYEHLAGLSQDYLLPGLEHVPNNTIGLLATNPRFVEAYMVGLNHEMAAELLWREYPTDQRGSYFRQFWDVSSTLQERLLSGPPDQDSQQVRESLKDIPAIHTWRQRLGDHIAAASGNGEQLVLLIRGDLLRKYPTAAIYAAKAVLDTQGRRIADPSAGLKLPLFSGALPPDLLFLGFDLTAEAARGGVGGSGGGQPTADQGWFFVIEQQASEPGFGLDEADAPMTDPVSNWDDLTWGHLASPGGALDDVRFIDVTRSVPVSNGLTPQWGAAAAGMASILLQKPVRVAIHATMMIPAPAA